MKHIFFSFLLLILSGLVIAYADTGVGIPKAVVEKINDRVYALIAPAELPNARNRGYIANSAVIIGDDGVILVDTGFSEAIGRHIKQTIETITDKPVTHIINTHDHGDHTLGNGAFSGAQIISSTQCKALIEQSAYEWMSLLETLTGEKLARTAPVVATTTYAAGTSTPITLQGVDMVIQVPQASHSASDLMLYLPDDKVLIAGDIAVNTLMPNFRDAHVAAWIDTLARIGAMPLAVIIPGHGTLMNIGDVNTLHAQMQTLYNGIETGYNHDLTDSEIRDTLDLTAWRKMNHFDELMGGNISRVYLEVEQANF
jgi:cyclase